MPLTPIVRATPHALARPAVPARIGLALVAVLVVGVVLGPQAQAVDCHVPGDYTTLQAAVDDPTCATINVAAGTYAENIEISRPVTLRGGGQAHTILDGDGLGSVVTIARGAVVTIQGVTIQGGAAAELGGGLFNEGMLTLQNSTVSGNTAEFGGGGGLFNGGTVTLTRVTFQHNTPDDCIDVDAGTGCP